MKPRIDYQSIDPAVFNAMMALQIQVNKSKLDTLLAGLVKLRASQINGCAFCIDMHTKEAREHGETEQRLYALTAWAETPFYNERERAALAWTEAVTLIGDGHVPDPVFARAREHFSEKELIDLTLAIVAINGWNRFSIAFRAVPGSYQPYKQSRTAAE
jgi:AhpD family alkylhydroperoxidase